MRFLDLIHNGDVILADHGFNIGDELAIRGAKLQIPAFTKGKKQLSPIEVEHSRKLAHAYTCGTSYWSAEKKVQYPSRNFTHLFD